VPFRAPRLRTRRFPCRTPSCGPQLRRRQQRRQWSDRCPVVSSSRASCRPRSAPTTCLAVSSRPPSNGSFHSTAARLIQAVRRANA
jgi:hypothetical protein